MVTRLSAAPLRRYGNWTPSKRPIHLFAASLVLLAALPLTSSAQINFAEFPVPSGASSNPQGIAGAPDGGVWFVETAVSNGSTLGNAKIGRISASGAFTEYTLPAGSEPQQIVVGPDNNLYFTVGSGGFNFIGQIVPSSGVITRFEIPTANASATGLAFGPGPGGTTLLWFAEAAPAVSAIAAMSTGGDFSLVTPIPITSGGIPTWLTLGPDNNIWFTEQNANKIGVVNTTTATLAAEYSTGSNTAPFAIASDGTNLWFTERGTGAVAKISTSGTITPPYSLDSASAAPIGITKGVDGAMWFTESGTNEIGRIATATGNRTYYTIPTANSDPYGITVGPDRALWFTETLTGAIGRISEITFESFINVPGALAQIAVGADGTVFGLNAGGYVYTSNGSGWINIPGNLAQISVGSNTAVWGLNDQSNIYHLNYNAANPASSSWQQIPGQLKSIYAGADGEVWGLNVNNSIYRLAPGTTTFYEVGGTGATLSLLAVGNAGAVYGVNFAGSLYWYNPGRDDFEYLTGTIGFSTTPGSLGVGVDGDLWAVKNGTAYHWDVLHGTMTPTSGGPFSQVIVGSGAAVFALGTGSPYESIWQWDATSATWIQISGNLASIAVGANGNVWGVNASQQIYTLGGAPQRAFQTLNIIPGAVIDQISVGVDGTVWAVSSNTVEFFNRGTQTFQAVPGAPALSQVSVGAGNDVWGVDASGNVYEYLAGSSPSWKHIPGELNLVQVGANGDVWGINAGGFVYYYDFASSSWVNIPGNLGTLSVGADGTVWGINSFLQIYRYSGSTDGSVGTWVNIPGSLMEISVGSASNIWGINAEDQIYTYQNGFHQIGGELDEVWATFDGAVWGVNTSGSVYRYNTTNGFQFVGNGVSGVSQVVLGNAANVWATYAGSPTTSPAVYAWF
jgi:virginiamycin B lyase